MRRLVTCILTASIILPLPGAAINAEEKRIEVKFADLNISSESGLAQLQGRIRNAIGQVCGRPSHRIPQQAESWEACRAQAQADAFDQLGLALGREKALALNVAFEARERK